MKIRITGLIFQASDTKEFFFCVHERRYLCDWKVFVCELDTEIEIAIPPEYSLEKCAITAIDEKLEKAAEAYYGLKAELEGKKANWLAIRNGVSVAPSDDRNSPDYIPF